ncbi:MAG: bifunctional TolB-family protein/amidohydrolase [Saprospiraceae bacterium]|nr:MAG: bifunctional TolB-family protein/amidohydrolase [Saprospiraceae bacterium]
MISTCMLWGQEKKEDKWDVNNPPGAHQEVTFSTTEGTWMNLDVSPDGKTIVFDLLGDIYQMPITGGKAKILRSGLAWEVQPRFSPNGKQILFTSDAGGGDNIWVMQTDGSEARQITKETFTLLNNATWTPDGQYFVARKHFTSQRSLGAGEMWLYHLSGGEGLQLTKRKNDQQDVNEPSVSPDGRYVYFSEDMYPGGTFQYNKDPNSQIFVIRRYDREKGELENLISGPGGACRPQISNDGKKLAYVRRVRTESVLFVHDLETGQDFPIFKGLSKDQQEAWSIFGVYTGFDWTPDDQSIIIWGQGKINKVNAKTGDATIIPFEVEAKHKLAETLHFENKAFSDEVEVNVIRHAITSPDEKMLVFNAVGYLWKKLLPEGKPERLTADQHLEFEPAFSPDGKEILYVSWDDEALGAIWKLNLNSGSKVKLTPEKGIYRTPVFSPDGKQVAYRKDGGNQHQGYTFAEEPGIYLMPAKGGKAELVTAQGEYPVFAQDGKRLFFQQGGFLFGSLTKSYHSCKLDGSDEKKLFDAKYAQRFIPSPDNRWVAWSELYKVYIAPLPKTGQPIGISAKTKAVPVAQVARDAGINIHWSADSKKLFWMLGDEYFSNELTERFKFLEGAVDSIPPMDSIGLKINLTLKADKPKGGIAFTNARIITMKGDEVIEKGSVLVEGNQIKAIGKVDIPKDYKIIDCSGKTIMPGIIDVHGHLGNFRYGLSPQKQWEYFANLAYGVTTAHDPSSNSEMIFSQSEMIKTGKMVGPRLFSTGTILYGADGDFKAVINNLDDARSALRRTKAYGAFSVKSYNQPRRDQRQQIIQAARELNLQVVPEGGSFFFHNLSMVADGHTGIEHNIPVAPLYSDVIQFWSKTKSHNTPTLIVNYGGLSGENYWYQHTNVWEKEHLLAFTPRAIIDSRSRHRTMAPEEEYENGYILTSKSLKKLSDAGVKINLGGHGQLQGLGAHWELWMLQQGGMSNLEALQCATINGAVYLGMDKQIGSIEPGKLADLVVLDKNPLEDIQNSEFVRYTMVNGRLYDAATMNEIGNTEKKRTKFYFEQEGSGNAFPLHTESNSFMPTQCSCRR